MRRTGPFDIGRIGAVVLAGALLCAGECRAQSSGGGLTNPFSNLFSGQKPAQAQAPSAPGAPPPWSGEDGAPAIP